MTGLVVRLFAGVLALGLPISCALAKALPDLVVSDVRLKATGHCDGRQPLIAGQVIVKNAGRGRGQIFTTRDMLRLTVRGHPELTAGAKFVNSMQPGDTQRVAVALGRGVKVQLRGTLTIDIDVDPRHTFAEANEKNNRTTVRVAVRCE